MTDKETAPGCQCECDCGETTHYISDCECDCECECDCPDPDQETPWDGVKPKEVPGRLPSDFSFACRRLELEFAQDALSGEVLTRYGGEEYPWTVPDRVEDAMHRSLFREAVSVVTEKKGKGGKTEEVRKPWLISQRDWSDLRAGEAGLNRRNDFEEYVSACQTSDLSGAPALDNTLSLAFGCPYTLLNREASVLLMTAMVRRGCLMDGDRGTWFDYCPILAGPQGTAKTKGLPLLFPPHLRASRTTSNALLMARSEAEFVRSITGMVLAVADEMAGRTRADREALKARITRSTDRVRRLYHDATEHRVRTAVVCATANPDDTGFIPDDVTGLRRWIPIMVPAREENDDLAPLDHAAAFFDEWRDHLWALAYAHAKTNPKLILSEEAEAEADVLRYANEKKVDGPFIDWLKDEAQDADPRGVTLDDLLYDEGVPRTQLAPKGNVALAAALQQADWRRGGQRRIDGKVKRVWIPPSS